MSREIFNITLNIYIVGYLNVNIYRYLDINKYFFEFFKINRIFIGKKGT